MGTNSNRSSGTQVTPKGMNQGVVLVDPVTGLPINTVSGKLDVNASVTATIGDIEIDATTSSVRIQDPNTGAHIKVNVDGSINVDTAIDSAAGDNISIGNTWKKAIDQASASVTYIGLATPGSALSAATWQIKRITVTGTQTVIEYANSNLNFSSIWNNRASLSYG